MYLIQISMENINVNKLAPTKTGPENGDNIMETDIMRASSYQ